MKEIGSEYSLGWKGNFYFESLAEEWNYMSFFRCGRDCLKYIADYCKDRQKTNTILLPSYCCRSMYQPFLMYGWNIDFYELDCDLAPNIDNLQLAINNNSVAAVLIMDYWGVTDMNKSIDCISNISSDIIIIEDITHRIFNIAYNEKVSFYIGSIRKWFGIYDGGFIISNIDREMPLCDFSESVFYLNRLCALNSKNIYLHSGDEKMKKYYRILLADAEQSLEDDISYYGISDFSLNFLLHFDISDLTVARKNNFNYLFRELSDFEPISIPVNVDLLAHNCITPFSMPIMVSNRDALQQHLASNGVYAPLLWKLDDSRMKRCIVAKKMENMMLSLPIDQRYDYADMDLIIKYIKSFF